MSDWLVKGVFNTILCLEECEGSGEFDHGAVNDFGQVVKELIELDLVGNPFTWINVARGHHTKMCLDLALRNE